MDVINIIMELYSSDEKNAPEIMRQLLKASVNYKGLELANLITSLIHTKLAVTNHKTSPTRAFEIDDLVDSLARLNSEKLKAKELEDTLIEKLLDNKQQDNFLKIFIIHNLPLGWVDELLEEQDYQTRLEALIQMTPLQYTLVKRSFNGKKVNFKNLTAKFDKKKALSSLYLDKVFDLETSKIATGLILLADYFKNLNINYDVFCEAIKESSVDDWENVPLWSNSLVHLKPFLSDKRILSYLLNTKDEFELRDCAQMLKRIKEENRSINVPRGGNLMDFHAELVKAFQLSQMPHETFSQEEIIAWEGESFNESLKIHIPLSTTELHRCSVELKICVGYAGYDKKIIYGKSNIFFIQSPDRIKYCIEISKDSKGFWQVVQAKGHSNSSLEAEEEWDLKVFMAAKNNPILT